MPKFKFKQTEKSISFKNYNTKKFISDRVDDVKRVVNKIAPTCFDMPELGEKVINDDNVMKLIRPYVKNMNYYMCTAEYFINNNVNISGTAFMLINYIMKNIEFQSNIINIVTEEAALALKKSKKTIYKAIEELEDYKIIKSTDLRGFYLINHNIIFKGSLTEFIKLYYNIYGNTKIAIEINEEDLNNNTDNINHLYKAKIKKYVNGKY